MKNTLVLNKNYFASRITRIIREKTFGKTYEIGPFTAHDLGIGPHEANFFKGFFRSSETIANFCEGKLNTSFPTFLVQS